MEAKARVLRAPRTAHRIKREASLARAIRFAAADWERLARVCKEASIEPSVLVRDTANMISALADARHGNASATTEDWYRLGAAISALGSIQDGMLREVATLVAELMYERLRPMPRARRTAS